MREKVKADPELVKALKEAGITFRTQLATAPKELLDDICEDHEGWAEQLLRILDGHDPEKRRYGMWHLRLGLVTPPHLNEDVEVYTAT